MGKRRLKELTAIAEEHPPLHKCCGKPMIYGLVEGSSSGIIDSETGIGLDWAPIECCLIHPARLCGGCANCCKRTDCCTGPLLGGR
jgi:hypothetical protein